MPTSDFATKLILAAGGKPTPSTLAALRSWQRWEGGHTANDASYNWLNRTDQGYPTINSVGVAAYPNEQTGISRTVDLFKSGYPSVYGALQSGQFNFADPGIQGDLNRWLTGKRTTGVSPYISKIAGTAGQNPGPLAPSGAPPVSPSGTLPGITQAPVGQMQTKSGQMVPRPMSTTGFAGMNTPADFYTQMMRAASSKSPSDQTMSLIGALMQGQRPSVGAGMNPTGMAPPQAGPVQPPPAASPGPTTTYPSGTGQSAGIREAFYDPLGAYDEGKWISPIGGHSSHVHLSFGTPDVALAAIKLAQQMGLRASENPYAEHSAPEPGVHTPSSYHYRMFPGKYDGWQLGQGLDVSGQPRAMAKYFNTIKQRYIS